MNLFGGSSNEVGPHRLTALSLLILLCCARPHAACCPKSVCTRCLSNVFDDCS